MRRALAPIALLTMLLVLGGCTGSVIKNIETSYAGSSLTSARVEQAIVAGMQVRGWRVQSRQPGQIIAELNVRHHQAVVALKFDETQYTIDYVSSKNLDESKSGRGIHRSYNRWVQHLDQDIQRQLVTMKTQPE